MGCADRVRFSGVQPAVQVPCVVRHNHEHHQEDHHGSEHQCGRQEIALNTNTENSALTTFGMTSTNGKIADVLLLCTQISKVPALDSAKAYEKTSGYFAVSVGGVRGVVVAEPWLGLRQAGQRPVPAIASWGKHALVRHHVDAGKHRAGDS